MCDVCQLFFSPLNLHSVCAGLLPKGRLMAKYVPFLAPIRLLVNLHKGTEYWKDEALQKKFASEFRVIFGMLYKEIKREKSWNSQHFFLCIRGPWCRIRWNEHVLTLHENVYLFNTYHHPPTTHILLPLYYIPKAEKERKKLSIFPLMLSRASLPLLFNHHPCKVKSVRRKEWKFPP